MNGKKTRQRAPARPSHIAHRGTSNPRVCNNHGTPLDNDDAALIIISATMPKVDLPTRFAEGVRVQEKKATKRIGTIKSAAGTRLWNVQFRGEAEEEKKASAALRICREAYGASAKSPHRPAVSVSEEARTGAKKKRAERRNKNDNDGPRSSTSDGARPDDDAPSEVDGAAAATDDDNDEDYDDDEDESKSVDQDYSFDRSSSSSSSSDDDGLASYFDNSSVENGTPPTKNKGRAGNPRKKKEDGLNATAKKLRNAVKRRNKKKKTTPKRRPRQLFKSTDEHLYTPVDDEHDGWDDSEDFISPGLDAEANNGMYVPEEGEGFDDALEDEEDDDGCGDPKNMTDANGRARTDNFDKPQSAAHFHFQKKNWEEKKRKLVEKKRVIEVDIKTTNKYEFAGRVEGRNGTTFANCSGTIVEVLENDQFRVQW